MTEITFTWRGAFTDEALDALHADAFAHELFSDPWNDLVERHSLGWVTASDADGLVGWLNVPWDGAQHAWLQDVVVAQRSQRQGVGRKMIELATEHARAAGCEWLHVDFDDELRPFYLDACGFTPTSAGLIRL